MSKVIKTLASILLVAVLLNIPIADSHSQHELTPQQYTEDFDYLWSQLRDNYAYFEKKETVWNQVRAVYRPRVAAVTTKTEFIGVLESVLDELYDPHTHLRVNTNRSTRLIPTGLDVWAEWENGSSQSAALRYFECFSKMGLAYPESGNVLSICK